MVPVCASMCHCKWQFFQTYQTCNDPCHKSRRLWQIPGGAGSHRPVPRFPNLMLSCPKAGEIRMPTAQALYNSLFSVDSKMIMIQHDPTWSNNSAPRCSKMFEDVPRCSKMFQDVPRCSKWQSSRNLPSRLFPLVGPPRSSLVELPVVIWPYAMRIFLEGWS